MKHLINNNLKIKSRISLWLLALLISSDFCFAQENQDKAKKQVNLEWLSFEEAVKRLPENKRPLMIDVYTDWCGWCKVMDKNTFSQQEVASYLTKSFYAVKLNAETKDTIRLGEKVFVFKPEYKSNELAISLLNGKMSYPSIVFLDEKLQLLTVVPGYVEAPQMLDILRYFGEGTYLKLKWEDYQKSLSR